MIKEIKYKRKLQQFNNILNRVLKNDNIHGEYYWYDNQLLFFTDMTMREFTICLDIICDKELDFDLDAKEIEDIICKRYNNYNFHVCVDFEL